MDIVTVEQVKTRMGLPESLLEADDAIESAIAAAQNFVFGLYESQLDYSASLIDLFMLKEEYFPVVQDRMFRMRLRRAFVEDGSVLISTGPSLSDFSALPAGEEYINLDKGIVYLPESYVNQYVKVSYAAGFSDPADVPSWIKEAVLAYVPGVLNTMQITNREDEYTVTREQAEEIASGILAPYMRGRAFMYRPMY